MKKISSIAVTAVLLALIYAAIPAIKAYTERQKCICSMLTSVEETYPVDDRLYRVIEKDTIQSGVFMMIRTSCDHGVDLHLTVYPDEGFFKGYIPDN
ncbi:MAG: hypothetical protein Q4E13_03065 [Clostridia bacterium]|nr:hypothetical protein [Clostridia bacterium]